MWNNRIVKLYSEIYGDYYAMCEVFYGDDGKPCGYGIIEDLYGDAPEDIHAMVELIWIDLQRDDLPVLEESDIC